MFHVNTSEVSRYDLVCPVCLVRLIGAFLTLSPELCMVVEDDTGVVGYAVAALDARQFYSKATLAWLPEMCSKYPALSTSSEKPSPEEVSLHILLRTYYS